MRTYGQYCPIARALDRVGERWTLLLIRELIKGPARFRELRTAFPRLASNLLTQRLREMEKVSLVKRTTHLNGLVSYELTESGRDLSGVLVALGTWGFNHALGPPHPDDDLVPELYFRSLNGRLNPQASKDVRLDVLIVLHGDEGGQWHLRIADGHCQVFPGEPTVQPHVTFESTAASWMEMHVGRQSLSQAIADGSIKVRGDRKAAQTFMRLFLPQPWVDRSEQPGNEAQKNRKPRLITQR